MDDSTKSSQAGTRKTPEAIRDERIQAITDPKVRSRLDDLVEARDTKLAEMREEQRKHYGERVAQMRDQKIRSTNGPQFAPPGMHPRPYLGIGGYERATMDAK